MEAGSNPLAKSNMGTIGEDPALAVPSPQFNKGDDEMTFIDQGLVGGNQKVSRERYVFHQRVLKDQRNLTKYALALAGFVMHEYMTRGGTTFRVSLRKAEKYLDVKRQHLLPARDLLTQRGHLIALHEVTGVKGRRNQAGLYAFGKGPGAVGRDGPSTRTTSIAERKQEKDSTENLPTKDLEHIAVRLNAGTATPRHLRLIIGGDR